MISSGASCCRYNKPDYYLHKSKFSYSSRKSKSITKYKNNTVKEINKSKEKKKGKNCMLESHPCITKVSILLHKQENHGTQGFSKMLKKAEICFVTNIYSFLPQGVWISYMCVSACVCVYTYLNS